MSRCRAAAASAVEDERVCGRRAARLGGRACHWLHWAGNSGTFGFRGSAWRKDVALAACEPRGLAPTAIGVRWLQSDPA